MKIRQLLKSIALSTLLYAGVASATLVGDTIQATGNGLAPNSATIGAGNEFSYMGAEFFDFGASTLTIHSDRPSVVWGDFGYFVFSGFDEVITGLSIASNKGYEGDPLTGFSFTANSITLHWGNGRQTGTDAALVFDIQTQQVPEPESLALVGLALAGLGLTRRKAKQA